ncbi:MAG: serine acetyltransferase [Lachnospiraceae bacterium]|nr:serine acetyltransferase [Lachnospiraceae bacterium]
MAFKDENEINTIVEGLLKDYEGNKTIDEIRSFDQPSRESLIEILNKLQKIVFPGYFRNDAYKIYTVRNKVTMLVEDVLFNLSKQIAIVLDNLNEQNGPCDETINKRAEEISMAFLHKLPYLREMIETDVHAAFEGDPAAFNTDEIIFSYPGLYAIFIYRIAHEIHLLNVPLIPRMMTEYAHSVTGIDIHPGAQIGKHFFIDHGTGIVIGETTIIGENVKLYQGVTLGGLSTRGGQLLRNKRRHPTIGDNVTIYSGASILGGETVIGKNAVIGGNVFITSSVPEGARISIKSQEHVYHDKEGEPQEVESRELPDSAWFYTI